jgi:hypothetical protein
VGEIGIPRREFLYDILYWEAEAIIRGYKRRNVLLYQLQRVTAYSAYFSMRENKAGKSPQQWLPLYFDNEEKEVPPLSQEDIDGLLSDIKAMNDQGGA